MDIGQRPSRQRRHLPSHGSTLPPSQPQQQKEQDKEDSDDWANDSYQPSRGRGRAKKRIKTSFENLMVSKRKETASRTISGIQWRLWFWRACVLWIAFLCLRVITSVWQGDVTRLGWNQYLSQQQPYRWW